MGGVVCEPAILIRRRGPAVASRRQIWSLPRLEHKLIHMRELYEELKSRGLEPDSVEIGQTYPDPFCESSENHNLIGVANVFLSVLFNDVCLDYHTPIISQQGEVAGRLQVGLEPVTLL